MSNLHLVTGYAGQAHVTAADDGSFNRAIFGSGQYVLDLGSKFAASVVSNNKITIADGDLLMQGRHVRLNEGTTVDLTINNGAQGKLRNDLIVARYTKDSVSGVEEVNLVVIQGTAVDSNPADPEYTSGDIINDHVLLNDMPLYRVPLDGLNVGTPVQLFDLHALLPDEIKSSDTTGNAATATKLKSARTIQVNLGSTDAASFDGSTNITPGVTGTLPIANGGTGNTTGLAQVAKKLETARNMKVNLAAEWDCYFDGSDPNLLQLGVMNALPVSHGGTGATSVAGAVSVLNPTAFSSPSYVFSMGASGYGGGGGYTTIDQLKTTLGSISIKKIWTNESPTSGFPTQTIYFSNSYDGYIIYSIASPSDSDRSVTLCVNPDGGYNEMLNNSVYDGLWYGRGFWPKASQIKFAYGSSGTGESADVVIPYIIYGIKGIQ